MPVNVVCMPNVPDFDNLYIEFKTKMEKILSQKSFKPRFLMRITRNIAIQNRCITKALLHDTLLCFLPCNGLDINHEKRTPHRYYAEKML